MSYWGEGKDTVYGRGGYDDISGQDGDDTLYGGAGGDSVGGNAGEDVLYGEEGDDVLWGVDGGDRIFGGVGRDDLNGGAGNDLLEGGDGDDRMIGGPGDDRLVGGPDNDRYFGESSDPSYGYGYVPGKDSAVINSTVAQATVDFASYGSTASWYPSPSQYSTLFVLSPDGVDTLDSMTGIVFNDAQTSGYVVGHYQSLAMYELFMGRKPTTAEYVFWGNQNAGAATVRDAILRSDEGQAAFADSVNGYYRMFVGRDATVGEIQERLAPLLATYEISLRSVREAIIASHPDQVTHTIADAYQSIAGRAPTAGEVATWTGLFRYAESYQSSAWGYVLNESFATTDTLVNTLLSDPGTGARALQLRGTAGADVFALPAGFINVRIAAFDPMQDRISLEGTAFAGTDPLDPAHARQTGDIYYYEYGRQDTLTSGNVLIELDALYQRYFDRVAMIGETATWNRLFANGATFDTLRDALLTDAAGIATGTRHVIAAADALALPADFGNVVIEGFDPAADTLSLRGTAFAGSDPLARAREVVGVDGRTDVLVTLDASHTLLFDNLALAQLSANDFLV